MNVSERTRIELPDHVPPVLVVDRSGEPHVFYHALDEVRHVFRGHCR